MSDSLECLAYAYKGKNGVTWYNPSSYNGVLFLLREPHIVKNEVNPEQVILGNWKWLTSVIFAPAGRFEKRYHNRIIEMLDALPNIKRCPEQIAYAALFDSAIAERLCRQNPVRDPSAKPHHGTYKGHRAITPQEREWIETLCTDHRVHPFVITMLYSGLRPQEAKALDIDSAVDFKKDEIYVWQSVHIADANHYEINEKVKTEKSARTVPLFLPVKKVLKGKHGYLITNADGSALTLSGWDRLWSSYVSSMEKAINGCSKRWYGRRKDDKDKKELPQWISFKVRPYDLRHSFVSWGRDNGVELHTMVEWCGHSDAKMIMKIYDEVSESRSKSEAAKLTRKVFKKKKAAQTEEKKMQGTK